MGLFSNYKLRKFNKALQSDPLRTVMATKVPLLFDAQSGGDTSPHAGLFGYDQFHILL